MLETIKNKYIDIFQKEYQIPNPINADLNLKKIAQQSQLCFERLDEIKVNENVKHFANRYGMDDENA